LGRCEIHPHIGKHIVRWDAKAPGVHTPEVVLGLCKPLIGGVPHVPGIDLRQKGPRFYLVTNLDNNRS
jgi:hypothetical protein